jgi:hypothetical protein
MELSKLELDKISLRAHCVYHKILLCMGRKKYARVSIKEVTPNLIQLLSALRVLFLFPAVNCQRVRHF